MTYRLIDPLAQSFFIETPSVITKVDLYFSAKDDSLPVFVQIRKNKDGYPGPYIIPFSETVVYPSQIITSSNSNVATSISFSEPIFLEVGEYSLTLGSDSKNYRVWVSEIGERDTQTDKVISEQPYIGSLFKSQNASTYTPIQTEDLKFDLYRANFNTNVTSTVTFVANNPYEFKLLEKDPLEVFPNSSTMRVHHFNHGMEDGTYVILSGLANARPFINVVNSFYGVNSSSFIDVALAVSNTTLDTYTINLPSAVTGVTQSTRFGGAGMSASQDVQFDTIYPVVSSISQSRNTIIPSYKATSTAYVVDSSYTDLTFGDTDLLDTKVLAGNVTRVESLSNNQSFHFRLELNTKDPYTAPIIDTKQLGVVLVKNLVDSPTYDTNNLGNDIITVMTTGLANVLLVTNTTATMSIVNSNDRNNVKSILNGTTITLSGLNPNNGQFRVVEVLESGANITIAKLSGNVVTDANVSNSYTMTNGVNFVSEEAAFDGSSYSKYVTRQIDFINESTSFNLRLDISKPDSSDIEVYYKTKLVGETDILSSKEYVKIDGLTIPTSLSGEFYEVETQLNELDPFNAIIIKVVFKSTNTARVPKIKNLRLIALE